MARELAISLYLLVFKFVFNLFSLLKLKDKTTFVVSFGDNSLYVIEEMHRQNVQRTIVILCNSKNYSKFNDIDYTSLFRFESFNPLHWIISVYHLATSKEIIVDNYFGFLSVTDFKEEVECIQLWHANGATKKFGLEDHSIQQRSNRAKQRFINVYGNFKKVVVGSDMMASTFMKSFNLSQENILKTGIPRTDFFFNEQAMRDARSKILSGNGHLSEKKIILYAPTYRDHEIDQFVLQLDLDKMHKELGDEYVLFLRLHPAIRKIKNYSNQFPGFVFDYSSFEFDINELLVVSDLLITDYSSIPYEYALLNKPMIFYVYDFEKYKLERGISGNIEESFPGPLVKTTEQIIQVIQNHAYDMHKIDLFSKKWNKYSNGNSSKKLVQYIFEKRKLEVDEQQAL